MDNLLTVALEAHHHQLDHHRHYRITVGRDLLGDWTVSVVYGRAGRPGQERRFGGDADAMRRVVRAHLLRRLSAPRRIGCAYRMSMMSVVAGMDRSAWVPDDLLAQFRDEGVV